MSYIDTYVKSKNKDEITAMCEDFKNHIGPDQGTAATTVTNSDGTTSNVAAKGDPAYWYAIIRCANSYVFPFDGVELATKDECETVCGTWDGGDL